MNRRRALAAVLSLFGLTAIGGALFWPESDEEKIRKTLDALAVAVSFSEPIVNPVFFGSHLADEFEPLLADSVRVNISEVRGGLSGSRSRLGVMAATALSRYGSLDVSLSDLQISLTEEAHVQALATLTATQGSRLKQDERQVRFVLIKAGGDYIVSEIVVLAPN